MQRIGPCDWEGVILEKRGALILVFVLGASRCARMALLGTPLPPLRPPLEHRASPHSFTDMNGRGKRTPWASPYSHFRNPFLLDTGGGIRFAEPGTRPAPPGPPVRLTPANQGEAPGYQQTPTGFTPTLPPASHLPLSIDSSCPSSLTSCGQRQGLINLTDVGMVKSTDAPAPFSPQAASPAVFSPGRQSGYQPVHFTPSALAGLPQPALPSPFTSPPIVPVLPNLCLLQASLSGRLPSPSSPRSSMRPLSQLNPCPFPSLPPIRLLPSRYALFSLCLSHD